MEALQPWKVIKKIIEFFWCYYIEIWGRISQCGLYTCHSPSLSLPSFDQRPLCPLFHALDDCLNIQRRFPLSNPRKWALQFFCEICINFLESLLSKIQPVLCFFSILWVVFDIVLYRMDSSWCCLQFFFDALAAFRTNTLPTALQVYGNVMFDIVVDGTDVAADQVYHFSFYYKIYFNLQKLPHVIYSEKFSHLIFPNLIISSFRLVRNIKTRNFCSPKVSQVQ